MRFAVLLYKALFKCCIKDIGLTKWTQVAFWRVLRLVHGCVRVRLCCGGGGMGEWGLWGYGWLRVRRWLYYIKVHWRGPSRASEFSSNYSLNISSFLKIYLYNFYNVCLHNLYMDISIVPHYMVLYLEPGILKEIHQTLTVSVTYFSNTPGSLIQMVQKPLIE